MRLTGARDAFDAAVRTRYESAHALLRLKFPEPIRLPFYYMKREQAAALAVEVSRRFDSGRIGDAPTKRPGQPGASERWLESADTRLVGRADYLDHERQTVIDYKSGGALDASASNREERQLRFYAHLANENGFPISRGVIVRSDGSSGEVAISREAAGEEGRLARAVLAGYQEAVNRGDGFDALASPGADACAACDAMPVCEGFWRSANPSWSSECGIQVEGTIAKVSCSDLQGAPLIGITLSNLRGTFEPASVVVEQVPAGWLDIESGRPNVGDRARVINGRAPPDRPGVIRTDRPSTTIWSG